MLKVGQRGSTEVLPSRATRASTPPSPEEERLLIDRVKAGEYEAFEAMFRRYVAQVYRQVFKLIGNEAETEEVVQEVFLAVHQKIRTFRGDSAFSTWLYRLSMNVALTKLRRRKRTKEVCLDDYLPRFQEDGHHLVRPVFNWGDELDLRLEKKELHRLIQEALELLPPMDKAVIVQSDIEGLSNREIGEVLGLSIPAVKARLHRARLFLRGKLAVSLGYSPT
ncbi:MAG: sigma-70 family RNA polymerase sigma factor [candidate division NC10 bacterium]|nr:sigma-70 family RNA polymerase sigma factor [candidate division NC10 bacterium]